jgi:hypothetical protein
MMELSRWQGVLGGAALRCAGLGLGFAATWMHGTGRRVRMPWARRSMRVWDELNVDQPLMARLRRAADGAVDPPPVRRPRGQFSH